MAHASGSGSPLYCLRIYNSTCSPKATLFGKCRYYLRYKSSDNCSSGMAIDGRCSGSLRYYRRGTYTGWYHTPKCVPGGSSYCQEKENRIKSYAKPISVLIRTGLFYLPHHRMHPAYQKDKCQTHHQEHTKPADQAFAFLCVGHFLHSDDREHYYAHHHSGIFST